MATSVLWFRRDLRLSDNPALVEAAAAGVVVPLFVVDPALWDPAGLPRRAFLTGCLRELTEATGGALVIRTGDPAQVVPGLAAEAGADVVWVAMDFGPYGRRRDSAVGTALRRDGRRLREVGSSYAVPPGTIAKSDATPYHVFTPFSRAWQARGWPEPSAQPRRVRWAPLPSEPMPVIPDGSVGKLGAWAPPGEKAALGKLDAWLAGGGDGYAADRNNPGADATSRLSPYLKWGCLHPRQLLSRLGDSPGHRLFRSELCWREFYADVLWNHPDSVRHHLNRSFDALRYDDDDLARTRFQAWTQGLTGFPIVDAGMRQLLAEGWMHNRLRMVVASLCVKDLHCHWTWGARHFMRHLIDGDVASNSHGWQWTAGSGTDAAPYFRVFNPWLQGARFDPDGSFVHRWVPELRTVPGTALHDPAGLAAALVASLSGFTDHGPSSGATGIYPAPIVEHGAERDEALARYQSLRAVSGSNG